MQSCRSALESADGTEDLLDGVQLEAVGSVGEVGRVQRVDVVVLNILEARVANVRSISASV